jgi:hypothetical protein
LLPAKTSLFDYSATLLVDWQGGHGVIGEYPLERKLISARASTVSVRSGQLNLNLVDVAFMISRDLVAWGMRLRGADVE